MSTHPSSLAHPAAGVDRSSRRLVGARKPSPVVAAGLSTAAVWLLAVPASEPGR